MYIKGLTSKYIANSRNLLVFCLWGLLINQGMAYPLLINVQNKASLQRGAKLFMNYCSGCHSLKYLRYSHLEKGLGLTSFDGHEDLLKNNLIFTQATINDPIRIALPPEDAQQWFGIVPPDLTLIAKEKGADWLYNYLSNFYRDASRPFGTNNRLVPNVAMPDILETMSEDLSREQFDINLQDLITFLAYVADPEQTQRYRLGYLVLGFLIVLFFTSWGLKKVYWRNIGIK